MADGNDRSGNQRGGGRDKGARDRSRRRVPKKPTAAWLERAALYYLERYSSSAGNLRRVLMRKIDRSVRYHGGEASDWAPVVAALVERLVASGIVDDRRYAEGRARSLFREGLSARGIGQRLALKQVAAADIEAAIAAAAEEVGLGEAASRDEFDLRAAIIRARRRRIGPFGPEAGRAARRARELAALGRAGFSYELARRVVDAPDAAALEEEE